MDEKTKKRKKRLLIKGLVLIVMSLLGASSLYLIYNIMLLKGIEDVIRYTGIGIIIIIFSILLFVSIKIFKRRKIKPLILLLIIVVLFASIFGLGGYYINKAYSSISNMNKGESNYGTSLITLSDSKIDNISDLKSKKIGIINDTESIEGYVISHEIIDEEKINEKNLVEYDDFLSMLNDLFDKKVDAVFISSSYISMFSSIDNFEDIKSTTKVITSKTKTIAKKVTTKPSYSSEITKPFTMLIMGIDSTEDDIKSATSFNGDSLILVTFNPKTLNATMLSIPRDTFVPIMCFAGHKQNKITHAAWYGESCMMSTIENFTGIDIDYYVKINFKGVVKLVDSLGGVEVNVPYSFCEQNSNREWGNNTVYVEKGLQTLNGEQALAFARNRHPNPGLCKSSKYTNYYSDDFVRGQNQQTVIRALLDKLKTVRDVNKLYEILDLIEKSMDTNLTTNQILSFYNIGKDILAKSTSDNDVLNFQKLYLRTYEERIYDESMKLELSDQIYFKGSLNEVVDAMKINLGLKEPTIVKDFSFSVNELYEEKVIGKGTYNEASIALVPSFSGYSKSSATSWGLKNNVTITFNTIESSDTKYYDGQITNQSVPKNSLVSIAKSKGITLTIIKKVTSSEPSNTKVDCTDEDNKNNDVCEVPDFTGKSLSYVTAWQNKITTSSVTITKSSEVTDEENKNNIVKKQEGLEPGDNLYSASSHILIITYYKYEDAALDHSGI